MFAVYLDHFCFILVNWTIETRIKLFSSITLLSNNRVAVCGADAKGTKTVKCFDIKTGTELDCAELKGDACRIAEVKHADTLSLVVSFPYLSSHFDILIFNSRILIKEQGNSKFYWSTPGALNIQSSRVNMSAIFLFSEMKNVLNFGIGTICLKFFTLTHWRHTRLGHSAQLAHHSYSTRINPRCHTKFTGWTVMKASQSFSKKSLSQHYCHI